jgi:esterase/lipase/1-acyl-sn-glycerol-3-phosphate acyltransferase
MGIRVYRATGSFVTAVRRACRMKIRITGRDHITDRPTLFLANHFTRLETFLVPYVLFHETGRMVHTLAKHSLFTGMFDRFFRANGVMSVRDPHRNRTILSELITGRFNWVIYPEGGIIKNKKTVSGGRLLLDRPGRQGPPHTGAAVLALRAETIKRRFLDAIARGDEARLAFYREQYGLTDPRDLAESGVVVQPISLTYHALRPGNNLLNKTARLFARNLSPELAEELMVEGQVVLGNTEVSMHFGPPLEIGDFMKDGPAFVRRVAGLLGDSGEDDEVSRRRARRLTESAMRQIYSGVEVNLDHLFCYGLRALKRDIVPCEEFHTALYLAAMQLRRRNDVRLHPTIWNGISALLRHEPYAPLDAAVELARREHVLAVGNGLYHINRARLEDPLDYHTVRLERMVEVFANEVEPIRPVASTVRTAVNLDHAKQRSKLARLLRDHDRRRYETALARWEHEEPRAGGHGEPYLLASRGADVGVVLVHGYLSCPEETRPLARHLRNAGYSVYGVRLEGHGTAPRDLAEASYEQWLECVLRGVALVRQHCPHVVVGGFSLGGILALQAAARCKDVVRAVFAVNAPLKLRDRRAALVPTLVRWNGAMRRLGLRREYLTRDNDRSESPDINYAVDYLRGVRQLSRAVRHTRRRLDEVTAPALIMQATEDPVVAPVSGARLFRRVGADEKYLVETEFDRHVIIRGPGCENVFAEIEQFLERVLDPARN